MSRVRDGAAIRQERINRLISLINKSPDISENKVKGLFIRQTGLTLKNVDNMIEELIMVEIVKRDDGKLSLVV